MARMIWLLTAVTVGSLAVAEPRLHARSVSNPPQSGGGGQRIEARDGDIIVVHNDARVSIVRRREAVVRSIFNPAQRWVVLLVDYAAPNGPDGRVDMAYTYNGVEGEWPIDDRWEGPAVVEDYSVAGEGGAPGLGLIGPQGLLQLLAPSGGQPFRAANATVLSFRGAGRGGDRGTPFDEAEQRQVAVAIRNAETQARLPSPGSASLSAFINSAATTGAMIVGTVPVRVGGSIPAPAKIVDVPPVLPDSARAAYLRKVVILELTIGRDGTVMDVRVLRSIPLLDAAAVEAARQWRYEPTVLNGQAVPVILTATVAFQ